MSFSSDYKTFAEYWLGRPLTADDRVSVEGGLAMPKALSELYQTFGGAAPLTQAHNQLLEPEDLAHEDGYVIFYVENQEAALWAYQVTDSKEEDPMIFQGSQMPDSPLEWHPEGMTLSEWIRTMSWWQLINGGYDHGAYAEGVKGAKTLIERDFPFLGEHQSGGIRFFGKTGQILCLGGDDESAAVWVAGQTPEDFRALDSKLKIKWDFSSEGAE